jgi:mono/diheme cytochrome c family protein
MSSRIGWFVLGIVATLVGIVAGGYLFIRAGGARMETSAKPLPLEQTIAGMAIRASLGNARDTKDPLPVDDTNMLAAADLYSENCSMCHGIPGRPPSSITKGMFPQPPQLFEKDDMVTRSPEGVTFWIVTHGIRLSGMPGFEKTLSTTQRWQLTMLVSHADKLSPAVRKALNP